MKTWSADEHPVQRILPRRGALVSSAARTVQVPAVARRDDA
jgi:hypothetical protein